MLAGHFELAAFVGNLPVTGLELFEQPYIFNGDNRLVCECLEHFDLPLGELPGGGTRD